MPARRRRPVEELSTADLRRMLAEKQRGDHKKRLEQFQKSGRIVTGRTRSAAFHPCIVSRVK